MFLLIENGVSDCVEQPWLFSPFVRWRSFVPPPVLGVAGCYSLSLLAAQEILPHTLTKDAKVALIQGRTNHQRTNTTTKYQGTEKSTTKYSITKTKQWKRWRITVQLKDACVDIYNAQRSVQTNLILISAEVFRHLNWGSLFPLQRKKFWVDELAICLDVCQITELYLYLIYFVVCMLCSFYLGHAPMLMEVLKREGADGEILLKWYKECGQTYVFFIIHKPFLFSVNPDDLKVVLLLHYMGWPHPTSML